MFTSLPRDRTTSSLLYRSANTQEAGIKPCTVQLMARTNILKQRKQLKCWSEKCIRFSYSKMRPDTLLVLLSFQTLPLVVSSYSLFPLLSNSIQFINMSNILFLGLYILHSIEFALMSAMPFLAASETLLVLLSLKLWHGCQQLFTLPSSQRFSLVYNMSNIFMSCNICLLVLTFPVIIIFPRPLLYHKYTKKGIYIFRNVFEVYFLNCLNNLFICFPVSPANPKQVSLKRPKGRSKDPTP